MQGSGVDPDPGPAPPPSLTLPPLSELDKAIRPDSGLDHRYPHNMTLMGSQSRSQSQLSDPHLHSSMHPRPHYSSSSSSGSMVNGLPPQHPQQLQMQQQQQQHSGGGNHYQYQSSGVDSRPPYAHDQHSRHSSSVGSLPDLYMSSPSAPSTTTTSSLSRADSLSSMEYLQGAHPGHSRRHLSSAGDISSNTTGSTTGSSYGPSRSSLSGSGRGSASGSVLGGGSRSLHHHHYHSSMGLGRANLTAAIHHQQQQLQLQQQQHAMTSASSIPSSSAHASVNTQRSTAAGGKDSNANGHGNGTGNGKSTGSSAGSEQGRNTTKRAAQNRAAQRAFRQRKDLYVRELERKAELLQEAEGQILQLAARNHALEQILVQQQQNLQQQQQSSPSSSGSPQPHPHDPNHHPSSTTGAAAEPDHRPTMARDANEFDEFEYDRFPRSTRDHPHPYHGSREELLSSPPPPPRLALNRHESTPDMRSAYTRGRESEYDADAYTAHRSLHQQQQQPQQLSEAASMHLERRGSNNSADSGDDHYGPATGRSDPGPDRHASARNGSMDFSLPSATPHINSVGSQQPSTLVQERPSLYRISTEGGRLGPLESSAHNGSNPPSAHSWHEENHKLRSPPQASFSALGGMIRGQVGGMVGSGTGSGDTEYMVEDRLPEGRPPAAAALYEGIKKRQSEGSFNWTGPRSSARSGQHPALSKQSSWSAFPSSSSPSSSKASNGGGGGVGGGPSVHLPPLNSHFREHPGDTEMQETPQQQYQVRHDSHPPYPLQHRGSASSLSGGRETERRMSGSEAGSMGLSRMAMSDSPDMSSSDSSRFTPSAMSMRYPSQQHQQQQQSQHHQNRSPYPQTPENEYPPALHSNGSPGQFRKRSDDQGSDMDAVYEHYPQHHLHPQHHRGLAVHEAMETAMRSP